MNPSEKTGLFPDRIFHSEPDFNGLGTGSRSGHPDFDPFAIPLDEEAPKAGAHEVLTILTPSSADTEASGIPQLSPVVIHETLLQCPFCLSVFHSGVAGRLASCPVCVAVDKSPAEPEVLLTLSPAKQSLPRLNRTGTIQPLRMRRSVNRVTTDGMRNGTGQSAQVLGSGRRSRLTVMIGAVLLVCGVVAALAGLAHSMEPTFVQPEPAHEIIPARLTCGTRQDPMAAGLANLNLIGN